MRHAPLPGRLALLLLLSPTAAADDSTGRFSWNLSPRGEELLSELGCVACHEAPEAVVARLAPKTAPDLSRVGARVTPRYLRRFVLSPHDTKPGTAMPALLHGLSPAEAAIRSEELTHFLASLGGPMTEPVAYVDGADAVEPGRALFHHAGCVACHAPEEPVWQLEVPWHEVDQWVWEHGEPPVEPVYEFEGGWLEPPSLPLGDLAAKTSVDALAEFLRDPLAVRPSGRMPSLSLTDGEARDIALYLLREQAFHEGAEPEATPGLGYEYYEHDWPGEADYDAVAPVRTGSVATITGLPPHRENHFGFRFRGWLTVDQPGEYTFWTTSDDGSHLYVGDEHVVSNGGTHPMQEREGRIALEPGRHRIVVTMFEQGGGQGLAVHWRAPGGEKELLPAERLEHEGWTYRPRGFGELLIDPGKRERGARAFAELGCARCHETGGVELGAQRTAAPPLFELASEGGCLDATPAVGLPDFALTDEERAALGAALADARSLLQPLDDRAELARTLDRMKCLACHRRDDVGGAHPDRYDYFVSLGDAELGDQGRFPPHLLQTGWKLRPEWMREILVEGGSSRPYMATRMPQFGAANVGHLPELFARVDGTPADDDEPDFDLALVEAGRRLAGTDGLGCIQCHDFAGYDSLGVPAVDLALVHGRVKPRWFRELLLHPQELSMNTRMPSFWTESGSPVKDVLGGDPERQVDALWTYLSLGQSMPLPEGLVVPDSTYELTPRDRPIAVGVFMEGVSPRTVMVGWPEHTHYAFDIENSRLAKLWRGRFFNARGTWHGRAGALESPPPGDVYDLAPGAPFAALESRGASWPDGQGGGAGLRARGRRYDAEGTPTFLYDVGPVRVEETVRPRLAAGGSAMIRTLALSTSEPAEDGSLTFRAALAGGLAPDGDGYLADDGTRYRLRSSNTPPMPYVIESEAGAELRVPIAFDAEGKAEIEVEIVW